MLQQQCKEKGILVPRKSLDGMIEAAKEELGNDPAVQISRGTILSRIATKRLVNEVPHAYFEADG